MLTALDVETHPIKPGCPVPRLVCVTTDDGTSEPAIYLRKDGVEIARKLLEDPETHITGHFTFFDLAVLAAEDKTLLPLIFQAIDEGRIHCTKTRQMIIDNAEGRLKFTWNEETNEWKKQSFHLHVLILRWLEKNVEHKKKGNDIWRLRYNELDGVALHNWPKEATEYAISDAVDTRRVHKKQEAYCAPHGLPGGSQGEIWQTQAGWALYLAGTWGVRTDPEAVAKLKAEVTAEYRRHVETAQKWGLVRKGVKESRNMSAIRAAVKEWYETHSRPMKWTDGGKKGIPQIATDREQLTDVECPCGLNFKGHQELEDAAKEARDANENVPPTCDIDGIHRGLWAVAEVVRLSKLLSTYVRALERGTAVPINPSYNAIVESFRTSCSQGMKIDGVPMGTNLQNPPRKHGVRECFIPRPGSVFVFSDYDTLEMLTLAQVCLDLFGYSHIAEAAWAGQDFHLALAADMMGISYSEAEKRLAAGDPEMIDMRQGCKIGNYGFAGGMSWRTFIQYAKGFGATVTPSQARKLYNGFRAKWREMQQYFAYVSSLLEGRNRVKVVVDPKSGLMRGRVTYCATANHFFQHRAACGAKAALYQVCKEQYIVKTSPLYGCRTWLFAHDEIGMEVPYDGKRASDAAKRLETVMVDEMKKWCPDVPIAATAAMHRRWYKGGKAVYQSGIMVPSKPQGKKWVSDIELPASVLEAIHQEGMTA